MKTGGWLSDRFEGVWDALIQKIRQALVLLLWGRQTQGTDVGQSQRMKVEEVTKYKLGTNGGESKEAQSQGRCQKSPCQYFPWPQVGKHTPKCAGHPGWAPVSCCGHQLARGYRPQASYLQQLERMLGTVLGVVVLSQGRPGLHGEHLSGGIFGWHTGEVAQLGATGIWLVEARDTNKHPTMHTAAPCRSNYLAPKCQ